MMLASITKTPELVIDEQESKALAKALAEVSNQYGGVPMSPEMMAWFGLIQTAGMVYGPRVFTMMARRKMERPQKRQAQPESQNFSEETGIPSPTIIDL